LSENSDSTKKEEKEKVEEPLKPIAEISFSLRFT